MLRRMLPNGWLRRRFGLGSRSKRRLPLKTAHHGQAQGPDRWQAGSLASPELLALATVADGGPGRWPACPAAALPFAELGLDQPAAPGGAALLADLGLTRSAGLADARAQASAWLPDAFSAADEPAAVAPGGAASTLEDRSTCAATWRRMGDIVQPRQPLDQVLGVLEPPEPSAAGEWLGVVQAEEILGLFAHGIAAEMPKVLPSLTRRDHHVMALDSPMQPAGAAPGKAPGQAPAGVPAEVNEAAPNDLPRDAAPHHDGPATSPAAGRTGL